MDLGGILSGIGDFFTDTDKSGGLVNGPLIAAGISMTGSLIMGLLNNSAEEEQLLRGEALERDKFEYQKEQDALAREERAANQKLALQLEAIRARAAGAGRMPDLSGYSRQADRLMQGQSLEQRALEALSSGQRGALL